MCPVNSISNCLPWNFTLLIISSPSPLFPQIHSLQTILPLNFPFQQDFTLKHTHLHACTVFAYPALFESQALWNLCSWFPYFPFTFFLLENILKYFKYVFTCQAAPIYIPFCLNHSLRSHKSPLCCHANGHVQSVLCLISRHSAWASRLPWLISHPPRLGFLCFLYCLLAASFSFFSCLPCV